MVKGGVTIPKDYARIARGFVSTSHSSQGMTVDKVFVAQSSASFSASSREQLYVSTSRGRQFCRYPKQPVEPNRI